MASSQPHGKSNARLALCAAFLLLAACGRGADEAGLPVSIQGKPRWRVLSAESLEGMSGFSLRARTPCRARFRLLQTGAMPEETSWQTIATGQTAQVLWKVRTNTPKGAEDIPAPGDAEAGRTQAYPAVLSFQFGGTATSQRRFVLWARPGTGRLLTAQCAPPGAYEPFDWSRPLELVALALTDFASGEARLLPRQPESRLVPPEERADGDRHEMVRVQLIVEPLRDDPE